MEPMTDREWAEWLRNATDDELRSLVHDYESTRSGVDARDELDRRAEKGCAVASVNIGKTEARDVDLMAAAVNAMPALLDELEAARGVVEAARSCDDGESLYEFASAIGYSDAGKALCDALDAYDAATKR